MLRMQNQSCPLERSLDLSRRGEILGKRNDRSLGGKIKLAVKWKKQLCLLPGSLQIFSLKVWTVLLPMP